MVTEIVWKTSETIIVRRISSSVCKKIVSIKNDDIKYSDDPFSRSDLGFLSFPALCFILE